MCARRMKFHTSTCNMCTPEQGDSTMYVLDVLRKSLSVLCISLHASQCTDGSAACAYAFTHTLAELTEVSVPHGTCLCVTRLSEPMTLHVVPIRSRIRSQSCLRPVCVTQLSEPMTLHVVPIRSRTRLQSLLRPACTCLCMCYATE
jgi:hypothetical protein